MATHAHSQSLLALDTRTIRVIIPVRKRVRKSSHEREGHLLMAGVLTAVLLAAFLMAVASQFLFGLFFEQMQQIHRGGRAQVAYSEIGEMSH